MKSSLLSAAALLAAQATAAPNAQLPSDWAEGKTPSKTAPGVPHLTGHAVAECTNVNIDTPSDVRSIMADSEFTSLLDVFLKNTIRTEDGWVNKLWQYVSWDKGAAALAGCSEIGGDCPINNNCKDYPLDGYYWSFMSVLSLHSKISTVRSQLLWDGWLESLGVDQMAKDFTPPKPDDSWAKWVVMAFSLASNAATAGDAAGPVAGMIGLANTAWIKVRQDSGQAKVDTASVQTTLKNFVGAAGNHLTDILKAATGHGDVNILPVPSEYLASGTIETKTAKFFSDTNILVDQSKDNASFTAAYNGFTYNVARKLVDASMQSSVYILMGDTDMKQGDCNGLGREWLPGYKGQEQCYYLVRNNQGSGCSSQNPIGCQGAWHAVPEDLLNKMKNTYKMDLKTYFQALIDCTLNSKDRKMDDGAKIDGSNPPRCFYNLPAHSGSWYGAQLDVYRRIIQTSNGGRSLIGSSDPADMKGLSGRNDETIGLLSDTSNH